MAARSSTNKKSSSNKSSTNSRKQNTKASTKKSSQSKRNSRTKITQEEALEQRAFHDEIVLVVTLLVSILLLLSNFTMTGIVGEAIKNFTLGLFGVATYILPFVLFIGIAFYLSNRGNWKAKKKLISGGIMFITFMIFCQLLTKNYDMKFMDYFVYSSKNGTGGGIVGGLLTKLLFQLFGKAMSYVIVIALFLICSMIFTGKALITALSRSGSEKIKDMAERRRESSKLLEEYDSEHMDEKKQMQEREAFNREERRKAKVFTLNKEKPYEVDKETGEILDEDSPIPEADAKAPSNKISKKFGSKHKAVEKVDMSEIQPNVDGLKISDSSVTKVPSYEKELIMKFGKSTEESKKEQPLVKESYYKEDVIDLEADLKEQVASMEQTYSIEGLEPEMVHAQQLQTEQTNPQFEKAISILPQQEDEIIYEPYTMAENEEEAKYEEVNSEHVATPAMNHNNEYTQGVKANLDKKVMPTSSESKEVSTEDIANEIGQAIEKPYVFPPLHLLAGPKKNARGMTKNNLNETAMKLQKTLESFGVRVTITNVSCGPAVTRYEIQPEQGVKVSKITSLADDIKLNLAAADIRIEAPIPGKAAVGIEVPNKENSTVMFRELIENKSFTEHPSDIAFAVGKDIGGKTVVTDIAKMPHLLIAGATGSGKSVCINTLIMSILYKANPNDVKLIMVDPKVVELSVYNGIPHLMIPVVTDPKKASAALNWAVVEMNERYKKFAQLSVRDLKSYNAKIKEVEHLGDERYKKLPQIVIIVDELADLMMVAPGEVEDAICRLAQMARAAGLHLVIATQRPSVNVITGLIKANVPSRIAFSVSSAIDSRTIIDGSGAEKLLGKGDMLFFPQGYPKPVRVQGAFISDKEVSEVVDFLSKENGAATYSAEVNNQITNVISNDNPMKQESSLDDYFVQAGKFIIEKDKASIGMLQRVYKIGFNRAARIMDQLCEAGVVGPEEGTKPRKVIMSMEEFEQYIEESV